MSAYVPPWWLVGACLAVGAAVTIVVLTGGFLVTWDHTISHVMRRWGVRFDPWPMRLTYLLTLFGQRGTVLVLTAPAVALLAWRARSVQPLLRYVLALALLTAGVYALKGLTGRAAPPTDALHTATGASFPSGHIANAIIVWGTVAWCAATTPGAPRRLARVLRVMPLVAPACVFVGMTILDYHWLTDFIAGICLGVVLLRVVLLPVWSRPAAALDRWIEHRTTARPAP